MRICVDLTKLDESVMREKHDLPSVDQTLGRLAGAKLFTKLDANSGCCQVSIPGSIFRLVARTQSATGGVGAQLHGMRRRTTQSIRADDRI